MQNLQTTHRSQPVRRFLRTKPGLVVLTCFLLLSVATAGFAANTLHLAHAATSTSTVTLTVHVEDVNAGKANAVQVVDVNDKVLDTCQVPTTARLGMTCKFQVPVEIGVSIVAQPAPGETLKAFQGSKCEVAPGPVCHLYIHTTGKQVTALFGTALPGPTAVAVSPLVRGDSPLCSFGFDKVTVNGSGFQPNSAAILTDDGTTVSTGTTDNSGLVSLSYTANSEPGVYRTLVVSVAGQTARTDVFNSGVYCYNQTGGGGSGSVSFKVSENDMDANRVENYVQFAGNPPVPFAFAGAIGASSGYGSLTTPTYACPANTTQILKLFGERGFGTATSYHFTASVLINC